MTIRSVIHLICLCFIIGVHTRGSKHGHSWKDKAHKKPHWKDDVRHRQPTFSLPDFNDFRGSSGSRLTYIPGSDVGSTVPSRVGVPPFKSRETTESNMDFNWNDDFWRTDGADDTGQNLDSPQVPETESAVHTGDAGDAELVDDSVSLPMTDVQEARRALLIQEPEPDESSEVVNPMIVGGEETDISLYPFIVSLQFKNFHQCAGAILNRRIILTAAHCVTEMLKSVKNWIVVAGRTQHSHESGQIANIEVVEQHPDYTYTKKSMTNDIAIIWLKDSLIWTDTVKPATLIEDWSYAKDELVTIIGWGRTSSTGTVSNVLRKVMVPLRGEEFCVKTLKNEESQKAYGNIMFCTREKGKDSCNGDSGGPVIFKDMVVGIVSHGLGACGATAAWNSKVTAFRDWIDKKLKEGPLGLPPEARASFRGSIIEARSASLQSRQPYIDLQEKIETNLSEDTEIVCNIIFDSSTNPADGSVNFFWTKVNETDFFVEGNLLSFVNVTIQDSGVYVCHVQLDNEGDLITLSRQTQFYIRHKPGPATIIAEKPTAIQGNAFKLQCASKPQGYPKPKYIWKKVGADQVLAVTNELIVNPVKQSTGGTYTCQPTNELGSGAVAYMKVKVVQPVQIVKPLVSFSKQAVGEKDFSMLCAAAGNPKPSVIWTKNGENLDLDSGIYKVFNYQYNLDGKTTVASSKLAFQGQQRLGFSELELSDSGNFSCIFENEAEKKETRIELKIKERPRTEPIISCAPGSDGRLYPHPSRCDKFMQCIHGRPLERTCGPGTAFNPKIQGCDYPHNAGCERYARKDERVPGGAQDVEVTRSASPSARSPRIDEHFAFSGSEVKCNETNCKCILPTEPGKYNDNVFYYGVENSSRVEYDCPPSVASTRFQASLSFKTLSTEGVLFYTVDSMNSGFVGVFLKGGRIHFSFNNMGFMHISSPLAYNDNEWHNVSFSRQNQTSKLVVDKEVVAEGNPVQSTASMRPGVIFLGGLRTTVFQQANKTIKGVNQPLRGCIRNFSVDGQLMSQARLSEFVVPCQASSEQGSFFPVNGGYLKTSQLVNVGVNFTLSMQIKPRTSSGVLLVTHGITDYLVVQLLNGSVMLTVNNGQGPFTSVYTPPEPNSICDGNWHRIDVAKRRHVAFLSVDSVFAEMGVGAEDSKETNTNQPLHIGGHPFQANKFGIRTMQKYVGCIKNLSINQQSKERDDLETIGDVSYDCPTT